MTRLSPRFILLGATAAFAFIILLASAFIVSQGEQALVLQFGRPVEAVQKAGLHFKMPFLQNVEYFERKLLEFNAEPKEVIAADQKRLVVDAFVRYRITDPLRFKQTVGNERAMNSRLNTILESSLRQAIGSVRLPEAISDKRTKIMHTILGLVNAQAKGAKLGEDGKIIAGDTRGGFGIEVVDVRIMRADLPAANAESVYRRMQTEIEREAKTLRAEGAKSAQAMRSEAEKTRTFTLAEAQRDAEIIRGEGDSEALRILGAAAGNDPDFYSFYRSLQAYRKALSSRDTTLVLSPESEFLQFMDKGARTPLR